MMITDFQPNQVASAFALLAAALKGVKLPAKELNEDPEGKFTREAEASEFMLMQITTGETTRIGFKHSTSRNYLFVLTDDKLNTRLEIPRVSRAFMRGGFPGLCTAPGCFRLGSFWENGDKAGQHDMCAECSSKHADEAWHAHLDRIAERGY